MIMVLFNLSTGKISIETMEKEKTPGWGIQME